MSLTSITDKAFACVEKMNNRTILWGKGGSKISQMGRGGRGT